MGYPIDDESCQSNSCTQRFEGGSIQWTAGRGTSLRYSEWGYCRALNVGATKTREAGKPCVFRCVPRLWNHANYVHELRQERGPVCP